MQLRGNDVTHHLAVMLEAYLLMSSSNDNLRFTILQAHLLKRFGNFRGRAS